MGRTRLSQGGELTLPNAPALRQAISIDEGTLRARFEVPVPDGVTYLTSTSSKMERRAFSEVDSHQLKNTDGVKRG